jgi:hypothetical protein
MLTALLTLIAICVVGIVLATLVFAAIAGIFGLVFAVLGLAVKVIPLLLVGWLVVKLVKKAERPRSYPQLSAADREWLDG